jgi:hypothetical protein
MSGTVGYFFGLSPLDDLLPPAALPGAKLLKKFDQNFLFFWLVPAWRKLTIDSASPEKRKN